MYSTEVMIKGRTMNRKILYLGTLLAGTMLATPVWATIDAAKYGVTPSNPDNAAALQRAFDAARKDPDRQVVLPPGNIAYSRGVTANGIRIVGSGSTVMAPSNPGNQNLTGVSSPSDFEGRLSSFP
jgi:hypothetical protein